MESLAAKFRLIIKLHTHDETRCLKPTDHFFNDVVDDRCEISKDNIDDSSFFSVSSLRKRIGTCFCRQIWRGNDLSLL